MSHKKRVSYSGICSSPLFGAPPPLKVEGKIEQFKLFYKIRN